MPHTKTAHPADSFVVSAAVNDSAPLKGLRTISQEAKNPGRLRFLVADDNGVNRRVAALQLEHLGHVVDTAADGDEALRRVAREAFDCVLMDVRMPGTDGLEVTRRIRDSERQTGRHLPILAMSADCAEEDRNRCVAAGMDECVGKPLVPRDAVAAALRVIGGIHAKPAGDRREPGAAPARRHRTRTGRMSAAEVRRQHQVVAAAPGVAAVLDRIPQPTVVIGSFRQIVYANPSASQLMPGTLAAIIGMRPGEALRCVHSDDTAGGCGTTRFCITCGAAKTLRAGQRKEYASNECRIASKEPGQDRELRVWSAPFDIAGEPFALFTMIDISDEKRRLQLERIFLHDVLNTAGGIHGITTLCEKATPAERVAMSETVGRLAATLIDELRAQQALAAAEHGELSVELGAMSSLSVLEELAERYRTHEVAGGRRIEVARGAVDAAILSDRTLLGRVVGNMIKNALEACPADSVVTLDCRADAARVAFSVHNPSAMPGDVQLQLFQRSFSTKGVGRGLGTYSMRLLSERYLGGTVTFFSSPEQGTTFIATFPVTGPSTASRNSGSAS